MKAAAPQMTANPAISTNRHQPGHRVLDFRSTGGTISGRAGRSFPALGQSYISLQTFKCSLTVGIALFRVLVTSRSRYLLFPLFAECKLAPLCDTLTG